MKTVLIDRSLVNMNFKDESTDKRTMFMYVCALAETGASYVEIDFQSVVRLPKPSGAENYIYRIGAPEEYVVANSLNFSYAVVPLKYHYILSRLEIPAIIEIETGDADVFAVLQLVSSSIDLSEFSMIRLVGDFDPDSIPGIISTYRRRSVIPLDICPTNTTLTALTSAITAYRAVSDAVTVSFGDYEEFASLEEMLIMLSAMYKTIVSPEYLEGICKASLFSAMFSESKATNLSMMMHKYMYRPLAIENIDTILTPEDIELSKLKPPSYKKNRCVRRNPASRVLNSLGIEPEMSDNIIEVLEKSHMDIFGKLNDDDKDLQ